jgi:RNA-directed DNA polymerase
MTNGAREVRPGHSSVETAEQSRATGGGGGGAKDPGPRGKRASTTRTGRRTGDT